MADDRKSSRVDESRDRIEDEKLRGIAEEGADEFDEEDVDIDDVEVVDEQPDADDDDAIL